MLRSLFLIAAFAVFFSADATASKVVRCNGHVGDYSDAKIDAQYAACGKTQRWQSLGAMTHNEAHVEQSRQSAMRFSFNRRTNQYFGTGAFTHGGRQGNGYYTPGRNEAYTLSNSYKTYTAENHVKDVDEGDNGVMWRTKNEDGSWSGWTNSGKMYRGQEVQFKFSMWRAQEGGHSYDKLKAWVDWSGDNYFNNGGSGDEVVIDKNWYKNHNASDRWDTSSNFWNKETRTKNSSDMFREYIVTQRVPMDAKLGDVWMRARVTCSDSLARYSDNFNLLPWGYQDQGEIEDYKLTIASRTPDVSVDPDPSTPSRPGRPGPTGGASASVPEPETYVLFSLLLGLMAVNRQRKLKLW